jgi:hypothetical protein
VTWIVADATTWQPTRTYDLWHDRAAFHFLTAPEDRAAYAERVLHEKPMKAERLPYAVQPTGTASILYGVGAGVLTLLFTAFGLWRNRIPDAWRVATARLTGPPIGVLKGVHSGVIGDYVMWITLGTALLGGVWALTLR